MKTIVNQYGDCCRHTDEEAATVVALNYGWEYCRKQIWKDKMKHEKGEALVADADESAK